MKLKDFLVDYEKNPETDYFCNTMNSRYAVMISTKIVLFSENLQT